MPVLQMHPELAAAPRATHDSGLRMAHVNGVWRVFGAIPRKAHLVAPCAAAVLDALKQPVLTLEQRAVYSGKVTLRPHVKNILDQNGVGSCATENTSQMLMVTASKQRQPVTLLNPWTLYRQVTNTDSGSDTLDDVQTAAEVGICPMQYWDRSQHSWSSSPPSGWQAVAANYQIDQYAECQSYDEMATFCALGWVVGISNSSFWGGGHSTTGAEYNADGSISGPNSWGADWGKAGWYTMPMAHIKNGFSEGFSQVVVLSVKYSGAYAP